MHQLFSGMSCIITVAAIQKDANFVLLSKFGAFPLRVLNCANLLLLTPPWISHVLIMKKYLTGRVVSHKVTVSTVLFSHPLLLHFICVFALLLLSSSSFTLLFFC